MENEKYIWEKGPFRKDPYSIPEGYFKDFPDRLMEKLVKEEALQAVGKRVLFRPWMAWVSGMAASLVIGWVGFNSLYIKPIQEVRFQESLSLIVDYYGEELHEGELAGYLADNELAIETPVVIEVDGLIQLDPGSAEQYIYESVGF